MRWVSPNPQGDSGLGDVAGARRSPPRRGHQVQYHHARARQKPPSGRRNAPFDLPLSLQRL